jgi:hypothetical protein
MVTSVNVAATTLVRINARERGKLKKAHVLSCPLSVFKALN